MLEVDGESKIISVKAMIELDHDLIFGMDFCEEFDFDAHLARGAWRSNDGEWKPFAGREASEEVPILAECAGISEVAASERELVEQLVGRLIPPENDVPGVTDLVEHDIGMQGAAPVRQKPRRMSPKMFEFTKGELDKLLHSVIIQPSASDWRSAPVITWRDDKGRMCFDYRDVNKAMKKDTYLIPNMDAILDRLRNARYISKVDLRQAYYQVPLERSIRKYTAFALPGSGHWQFMRMPFGLANAPATFQRLIDALFGPEYEPYVFCYLDDIIIVTETFDEHLKWLEIVLPRIADAGLVVQQKKCEFCCASVTYLGYLLD